MLEKTFENKIKKFLKEQNIYYVKFFGCAFTRAGVPDLLCCINGKFVALEIKADKGKPSQLQLQNIKQIEDNGGIGYVIYPKDFEKLKEMILKLKKNNQK